MGVMDFLVRAGVVNVEGGAPQASPSPAAPKAPQAPAVAAPAVAQVAAIDEAVRRELQAAARSAELLSDPAFTAAADAQAASRRPFI